VPEAVPRQSSTTLSHTPPSSLPPQTSPINQTPPPPPPTHASQTHRPNDSKRETPTPRVDLINPVGGGSREAGEREFWRGVGGEGEKGWIWHSKSFFSVGVKKIKQGKARQGKARQGKDKENKCCIPQTIPNRSKIAPPHPQNPRVTKVDETVLAKRNKERSEREGVGLCVR